MYHIVFNADEKYIKYLAVLINSIILHTNIGGGGEARFQIAHESKSK